VTETKKDWRKMVENHQAKQPEQEDEFISVQWFNDFRKMLDREELELNDFRDLVLKSSGYYQKAVEDARPHITAEGHLVTNMALIPGYMFFYRNIWTDAQQSRRLVESAYDSEKAAKTKWLLTDPEAKNEYGSLKITEAKTFAEADDGVVVLSECVRILAHAEHVLEDVYLGFSQVSMMLSKISDLSVAGIEEKWIDPVERPTL